MQDLSIPFEKHVLENGLGVVLHPDRRSPVVSVCVVYHVGSGRESPGRSGFAHLFEHLMFQGSRHVGDDMHFRLITEAGGTLNGTTNRDRTSYFETLPRHQLDLALWLEADRMGFLLPAIDQAKLDNQRDVVLNERRQNYENRPYGQAGMRILAALYPPDHGYSWPTIGFHEDLEAASLEDVIDFFSTFYGPDNATLAIGGDFDPARALERVERWFSTIPRGPGLDPPARRAGRLAHDRRLAMEDRVRLPQLTLAWPGVHDGHADEPALVMLSAYLAANSASVLDRALTVDDTLATFVTAGHNGGEQAGEFSITARPVPGVGLDELAERIGELLAGVVADGVDAGRLERLRARREAQMLGRFESVAARTAALAEADVLRGDPGAVVADLDALMAVTPGQVRDVAARCLVDRPAVALSVVPEGGLEHALTGRGARARASEAACDRSSPPAADPPPLFRSPPLWHRDLGRVRGTGMPYDAVPLAVVSLSVPGGHLREDLATLGVSSLLARLLEQGTERLDAVAFEERLDALGASLSVDSGEDEITLTLQTLARTLEPAAALLGELLAGPRLAERELERVRSRALSALRSRADAPRAVAGDVWRRLLHDGGVAGRPASGVPETVETASLDDVTAFHAAATVADGARLVVVGDVDAGGARRLLDPLAACLPDGGTARPLAPIERTDPPAAIHLVDRPGAPQSEIRVGHGGVTVHDPDHFPFAVLNHVLGGAFNSRINMNLREDKGYTYGARSSNVADDRDAVFTVSASVHTEATAAAVAEIVRELEAIRGGPTDEEVDFARDGLTQAMSRQYESLRSRLGLASTLNRFGLPDDLLEQRQAYLREVRRQDLAGVADRWIHPDRAWILLVGDAARIAPGLEALGRGPVIRLDGRGETIDAAG